MKHLTVILCSGTDRAAIITTGKKITQLFFNFKKKGGGRAKRNTYKNGATKGKPSEAHCWACDFRRYGWMIARS